MEIDGKCAIELLEIYKYLDDDLKSKFSKELIDYLNSIKDDSYHFEINKNIPLYENNFREDTILELMKIITN